MHLDTLVQWDGQVQATIAHRRGGRAKCAGGGGSGILAQGDGRPRHQCALLWWGPVSAIRSAPRGDLFAGRIAIAFSAAGGANSTEIAWPEFFTAACE